MEEERSHDERDREAPPALRGTEVTRRDEKPDSSGDEDDDDGHARDEQRAKKERGVNVARAGEDTVGGQKYGSARRGDEARDVEQFRKSAWPAQGKYGGDRDDLEEVDVNFQDVNREVRPFPLLTCAYCRW